jgi:hypothetical protein
MLSALQQCLLLRIVQTTSICLFAVHDMTAAGNTESAANSQQFFTCLMILADFHSLHSTDVGSFREAKAEWLYSNRMQFAETTLYNKEQ